MVRNGRRFCDVCSKRFEEGEKFCHYTVDAVEGPAGVDVCLDCRMKMRGKEMETLVN